jgi:thiol-disulfide isomerase/thioredoxin
MAAALQLTLLTRAYCHLCDEMLDAVAPLAAAARVPVVVIDVDADPSLEATYGDRVPVLIAGDVEGGTEICHYRLDRARVRAALAESAA